jgi:hypothetical protein
MNFAGLWPEDPLEITLRQAQGDFSLDAKLRSYFGTTPKYSGQEDKIGFLAALDVFLFPQRIPSLDDPEPPIHTLDTLKLPRLILELFDVGVTARNEHIWEVRVKVLKLADGRYQREVQVWHQGRVVDQSKPHAWWS